MSSIFKKLISSELGENRYNKYFCCYRRLIVNKQYDSKQMENEEVYNDILEHLKNKDIGDLTKRLERLLEAMYIALRISKHYIFTFIFCFFGIAFIIIQNLMVEITVASILLISLCFLYKTYEFFINRYCYIDAHIILVYKSVLDKLIVSYNNKKE
jgi:hypothetical protein